MTAPILSVRNLTVDFKTVDGIVHAVDDVSYDLATSETLGIVGESGSGKSVSSMAILGLLPSTASVSGEVLFHGENLVGIPNPSQRAKQYPHEYSGGMRQRAMIAMAIANDPDLLIADEPTTALDVTIQAQVLDVLERIQDRTKSAILLITHDLGVVAGIADRVLVMYAGRQVEIGDVDQTFYDPRHPYTRGLLGSLPRLDVSSAHQRLARIEGQPPSLILL